MAELVSLTGSVCSTGMLFPCVGMMVLLRSPSLSSGVIVRGHVVVFLFLFFIFYLI